ncbi:hypothetical protein F4782DRAFT_531571 [Xylaria castorea]|nr:hypothetical protein F4782DRAFT_531571 [Xylaria castorea]
MGFSTKELEDAVCNIIQIIKQIPELVDTKLKITGELAQRRYLDQHQPVDKVHFVADLPVPLELFTVKLLEHPLSPFRQENQVLSYHSPEGRSIPIKISKQLYWYQVNLVLIHNIGYATVPYITWQELDRLYPSPSRSGASDIRKRQYDAKEGPALKSRHTTTSTRRQVSDEHITKQSTVIPSPKDVIAENTPNDGGRAKHRRSSSDPCLYSSSLMMTKK